MNPRSCLGCGSEREEGRKALPWGFHGRGERAIGVEEGEGGRCSGCMLGSNQVRKLL